MNKRNKIRQCHEIARDAFRIYHDKFFEILYLLIVIPFLGFLPLVILSVVFLPIIYQRVGSGQGNLVFNSGYLVLAIIALLFWLAAIFFSQTSIYLLIRDKRKNLEIGEALKTAWKYVLPYTAVTIFTCGLIVLWSLVFVIPGLILAVYLVFTKWLIITDKACYLEALKKSFCLVQGYWLAVCRRLFALALVIFLFLITPTLLIYKFIFNENFLLVWNIFFAAVGLLLSPYFIIYVYEIYKDLIKISKL